MSEKPPLWADFLLTLWVGVVALFYFGGFFLPDQIGVYTEQGAKVYALMTLVSLAVLAVQFLRRTEDKEPTPASPTLPKRAGEE